jgi:hypothetical protein
MLPGLRILAAAAFVTAIVATWVAASLMRAPAESLPHSAAYPHFEQAQHAEQAQVAERAQVAPARAAKPKEQSRMPGYAGELRSGAPDAGTMATSTYAKTQTPSAADDSVVTSSVNSRPVAGGAATASYDGVQPACAPCYRDDETNRMIRARASRPARVRVHAHRLRFFGRRMRVIQDRGGSIL